MDIVREETTVTTHLSVSVTELLAAAGPNRGPELLNLFQKSLNNGGRPKEIETAAVVVQEAPAPARRLLPEAGGKPLARCPKCHTDLAYYKLPSHVGNKSCKARQKRQQAAERRLAKLVQKSAE